MAPETLTPDKFTAAEASRASKKETAGQNNKEKTADSGEVVSLDAFRKK